MTDAKSQAIARALTSLGSAYRGDWSDFDGRTLKDQLGAIASRLSDGDPFDADLFLASCGVCPQTNQWVEHCTERSEDVHRFDCDHLVALRWKYRGGDLTKETT